MDQSDISEEEVTRDVRVNGVQGVSDLWTCGNKENSVPVDTLSKDTGFRHKFLFL